MHLIRTLAPAVLPVTLAEVKAGVNPDEGSDDDARIAGLIRTAVEMIDGPDGEIQRQLITATWELRLDAFPGVWEPYRYPVRWPSIFCPPKTEIEIPLPPLQEIMSITYLSGGETLTLDPADYVVAGIGDRWKARIRHVTGWPSADYVTEAVVVTFVAGYGPDWNFVPEPIRTAIIARVAELFDGCTSGIPEKLLAPFKVDYGFA